MKSNSFVCSCKITIRSIYFSLSLCLYLYLPVSSCSYLTVSIIYLSVCFSLSACISVNLSTYVSISRSACLQSVYLCIYLNNCRYSQTVAYLSIDLYFYLYVCMYICLSLYVSVCRFVCMQSVYLLFVACIPMYQCDLSSCLFI